jgi:hypothetical protein
MFATLTISLRIFTTFIFARSLRSLCTRSAPYIAALNMSLRSITMFARSLSRYAPCSLALLSLRSLLRTTCCAYYIAALNSTCSSLRSYVYVANAPCSLFAALIIVLARSHYRVDISLRSIITLECSLALIDRSFLARNSLSLVS